MTTTNQASLALVLLLGACTADTVADAPSVDDFDGKADDAATARSVTCHTMAGDPIKVVFTPNGGSFEVAAGTLFALTSQRPSLNATVEDGASDVPNEFVDFRPSGLDVIPPTGTPHFELALTAGAKALTYGDASTQVALTCTVSSSRLLAFLGIAPTSYLGVDGATSVGFDIDDTLLFSTPTFTRAFATGGTPKPDDAVFWTQANRCDPGCPAESLTLPDGTIKQLPASVPSGVKDRIRDQVAFHQARGAEVYAITARPDINGDALRTYIETELGIPSDHVFFEPDLDQPGNPAGKTDRMAQLGLDVFYGDSDSDITDAQKTPGAHVRGIRVLRSPKSSNRSGGRLAKYHPGYYGESILAGSYN
jgi:acid phosphatase (class B)